MRVITEKEGKKAKKQIGKDNAMDLRDTVLVYVPGQNKKLTMKVTSQSSVVGYSNISHRKWEV